MLSVSYWESAGGLFGVLYCLVNCDSKKSISPALGGFPGHGAMEVAVAGLR